MALRTHIVYGALGFSSSASSSGSRSQIVFLIPDQVFTTAFINNATELASADRLERVYVDKAHEVVLSTSYRDSYIALPPILKKLEVPHTLLAATAPRWIQDELECRFFSPGCFRKLVGDTERWNLSYEVEVEFNTVPKMADRILCLQQAYLLADERMLTDLEKVPRVSISDELCTFYRG